MFVKSTQQYKKALAPVGCKGDMPKAENVAKVHPVVFDIGFRWATVPVPRYQLLLCLTFNDGEIWLN